VKRGPNPALGPKFCVEMRKVDFCRWPTSLTDSNSFVKTIVHFVHAMDLKASANRVWNLTTCRFAVSKLPQRSGCALYSQKLARGFVTSSVWLSFASTVDRALRQHRLCGRAQGMALRMNSR
jgi:hypothetical protein